MPLLVIAVSCVTPPVERETIWPAETQLSILASTVTTLTRVPTASPQPTPTPFSIRIPTPVPPPTPITLPTIAPSVTPQAIPTQLPTSTPFPTATPFDSSPLKNRIATLEAQTPIAGPRGPRGSQGPQGLSVSVTPLPPELLVTATPAASATPFIPMETPTPTPNECQWTNYDEIVDFYDVPHGHPIPDEHLQICVRLTGTPVPTVP